MSFLSAERRSRLRVLLANLVEGQREYEEIGVLDAQIRLDYHGRFLIELLQNAVDPAIKAGVRQASLLIVRTPSLLAVLNQGAPFDEAGLRSILSLGLSSKKPDEAIGNKGVGFKSVFEVADRAEIFSARDSSTNLAKAPDLRLSLSYRPAGTRAELVEEAMEVVRECGKLDALSSRYPDVRAKVTEALSHAPGWRFPEELSAGAWTKRWGDLGLKRSEISRYQTSVLLHLRPGCDARVDQAMQDLTVGAEEVHLFLPGVKHLEIRTPEGTLSLVREDRAVDPERGIMCRRISVTGHGKFPFERDYWVKGQTISGPELEKAAQTLPGEGWATVTRAEVQVALPVPMDDGPLDPDGRYFIGLPSKDRTGSPFRVDARFHATLSRTSLDRRDNPFNVLLDKTAASVAAELLRHLRDAPDDANFLLDTVRARRAVTLGLASSERSGFADAVRAHLSREPVVLLQNGGGFSLAKDARRVAEEDEPVVTLVHDRLGVTCLHGHGILLVEENLAEHASPLLTDLGVPAMKPIDLLQRRDGVSLVESLAGALPRADLQNWRTLLRWLADRAGASAKDQRVLPVGGGLLEPPSRRPFVPLVERPVAGEVAKGDVPGHLASRLLILDAPILEGDEDLRRILIEGKQPLARRPGAFDLIDGAILPALADLGERGEDTSARDILVLGLRLLAKVPESTDVKDRDWRVPTTKGWIPASDAYLGDAWSQTKREEDEPPGLVEVLFGSEGLCVVPWWGADDQHATIRAAFLRIGVSDVPRILVYQPIHNVIWGNNHRGHPEPVPGPASIPPAVWRSWLVAVASINEVDWGPQTWWRIEGVEWIEGLERPGISARLAGWAMAQRHDAARLEPTNGSRWKRGTTLVQPWMFFIRQMSEPFVPSHTGSVLEGIPAHPADLCRLPQRTVVPWLPRVADGLNDETLRIAGVRSLQEMPAEWLVQQVSTFAVSLKGDRKESQIARELWDLLAGRSRSGPLPDLAGALLPVWLKGAIVSVRGAEIERLIVVDDPYAAEILGDHIDGAMLLEPEEKDWKPLVARLRERLPSASIVLVSEMEIPFRVDPQLQATSLPATLARLAGDRVVAVIAALIHRSGIAQKEMRRCWDALVGAKIQVGALPTNAPLAVWIRKEATLICQDLDGPDIVAEVWPVLGPRWREEMLGLGRAAERGARGLREYLRHKAIPEAALEVAADHFGLAKMLPGWRDDPAEIPRVHRASYWAHHEPAFPAGQPFGDAGEEGEEGEEPLGQADLEEIAERARSAPTPRSLPPLLDAGVPAEALATGSQSTPRRVGHAASSPGPARRTMNEQYAREIGHRGEVFAFRTLKDLLPGFDESCWVSTSRSLMGLTGGDDTLGYDFRYLDVSGKLCGNPGVECLIDVKSNAGSMRERFTISPHEWRLAEECHHGGDRVYVILRVFNVATDPGFGERLIDPVQRVEEGTLSLTPKDGWWADSASPRSSNSGVARREGDLG